MLSNVMLLGVNPWPTSYPFVVCSTYLITCRLYLYFILLLFHAYMNSILHSFNLSHMYVLHA